MSEKDECLKIQTNMIERPNQLCKVRLKSETALPSLVSKAFCTLISSPMELASSKPYCLRLLVERESGLHAGEARLREEV
jgi:hypothetical protein